MKRKRALIRWGKRLLWTASLAGFVLLLSAAGKKQSSRDLQLDPIIKIDYSNDLHFVKHEEVAAVLESTLPRGLSNYQLHELNLTYIEKNIESLSYVKTAEVSVDMHGKMRVTVEQREPLLRVINRNGVSYYLDQWGEKIPVTANFTSRVPVVSGHVADNGQAVGPATSETILEMLELVQFLQNDAFFEPLIEQLYVREDGQLELVPKVERHTILLGTLDHWPEKLNRLRLFYQKGLPKAGWKNYSTIDVRFDHQIVCKR